MFYIYIVKVRIKYLRNLNVLGFEKIENLEIFPHLSSLFLEANCILSIFCSKFD